MSIVEPAPLPTQLSATSPTRSVRPELDAESAAWLAALGGTGAAFDDAVRQLHGLLLRAARFQVNRSRGLLPRASVVDLDGLAQQAADDATMAVLARLRSYEGRSRFTTWAYKFAILHAAVAVRRTAWQRREIPVEPSAWPFVTDPAPGPEQEADADALATALRRAIIERLTPHQRMVLIALAIEEVPVDVLAERLATTRGALYKTLHDARIRLRLALAEGGIDASLPRERRRT